MPTLAHNLSPKRLRVYLRRFGRNEQVVLSILALTLGAAAGGAAILFRLGIESVQLVALGFWGEEVVTFAAEQPWWRLLLAPAFGGLLIGIFVWNFMPGGRPQGVAHVIAASALAGGRMSIWVGLKAAVTSFVSIGVGASVGREGPVVHLGAAIGSLFARMRHLGPRLSRTLLGCGVAAAVAASFNAPIAGVFFALEVVVGHYALSAFAPIVIASVTGTVVSRMYYGNYPAFVLPDVYEIASVWEFPAFALLGAICAFVAITFMRSVFVVEETFNRYRVPPWARPAFAGLAVGAVAAVGLPHILGVGYEATDAALLEVYSLWLLVLLAVMKTAATAICLGAGFGGGVFSPSLFIGAMVGGAFGVVATMAFPELSSGQGAYTIVGMGAVAGSVLGAPISTILMIFELTGDYAITIAVMVGTVVASVITQQLYGRSFFHVQLERAGINIRGGQEVGMLRSRRVASLLDPTFETVSPETPLAEVRERLVHAPWGELFVLRADGRLAGTITFHDMGERAVDTSRDAELTAASIMRKAPPAGVLAMDDDLERAVEVFGVTGEAHLPVVSDRSTMQLRGLAHEHALIAAYHRALTQARREERGEA